MGFRKIMTALAGAVWDLVLILGAAAVAVGIGMIDLPAGIIAGGAPTIAAAVLATATKGVGEKQGGGDGRA